MNRVSRISRSVVLQVRKKIVRIPFRRYLSIQSTNDFPSKRPYFTIALSTLALVSGSIVGGVVYLEKTSRLQLFEYARSHRNGSFKDSKWRDCFAMGLVDLYRKESGARVIERMQCGRMLGKWVADDKVYFLLSISI